MKLAVYSTKQYDKKYLQHVNETYGFDLEFFDFLLTEKTAKTAHGCEGVCIFVNDDGSRPVLEELKKQGVKYIALRCAGFNNVDLDAAKELGDSGADLYKVEMPLYGKGPQQELLSASQRLNDHINMPWVILSSGVDEKLFPRAVRVAMTAGASGFLAGRAVWASVVGLPDNELMLRDVCAPKLQQLGDIVDEMMAKRR